MKRIIFFIVFFYSIKTSAQNVSVTISDPHHFFKTVQYIEPDIRRILNTNVEVETLDYDSNGNCILRFSINSTTDLHLFNQDVIIEPNDRVIIKIGQSPNNTGSPHLTVITKFPGNFWWRKKLHENDEILNGIVNSKKYSLFECKNKLLLNYMALKNTFENFCTYNPVSPKAKEIFKRELFFYYVQGLCSRFKRDHDQSITFKKYFEGINYRVFNNEVLLKNSFIYRFCLQSFFNEVSENFDFITYLSQRNFTSQFQKINKFQNGFTKDYLYAYIISDYFIMKNKMHDNVDSLSKINERAIDSIKNINIKRQVLSLSENDIELKKIDFGALNKIEIENQNHEKEDLLSLINENKGKVIVCDVWASWCIPCLHEFEFYSSLVQKFKSDQVLFVTISIDENISSWQKKVSEVTHSMHHYILKDKVSNGLFSKIFGITEIPRTIIFGPQENVANYFGARPSEGNALEHQIDKLL